MPSLTVPQPTEAAAPAPAPIRASERLHPPASPRSARGQHLESLAIFLLFGAAYAILGFHVITAQHVVPFEALDRFTRAFLVWHDTPPKLAVIGFDLAPIPTLLLLPVTLIKPVATSLVGLPLSSAIFAAGVLVLVNRLLAHCEMPAAMRYLLLLAFGANPLFVFYASNGQADMVYLFFLAATLYALLSWLVTGSTRFLILAGLSLAICVLARYEFIVWALPLTLMVTATLIRWRASQAEVEGTAIVFAAPFAYALVLWTLFNELIVGSPFNWITDRSTSLAINSDQLASGGAASLHLVISHLGEIVSSAAPLAFAVLPVLMLLYFAQRDEASLWIAGLIALAIAVIGADALIENRIGVLTLSNGLTIALTSLIGAAWIYRSANGARTLVWLATLALLAAAVPLSWSRMQTYPFQNQEQAFVRALKTGADQEGTTSIGGYKVGIAPELQTSSFINRTVTKQHAILTDNSQTYAVILLSGRPQLFLDRVQRGDATWKSVSEHPNGRVSYMLISTQAKNDLLRQRYPDAANGMDPSLPVVFHTSRYVLVRVPPRTATATASGSLIQPATAGAGETASSSSSSNDTGRVELLSYDDRAGSADLLLDAGSAEPMSEPDFEASVEDMDSMGALSAAVARQIEVIVTTAETAATDLVDEVEGVATRRATDILIDAERRADRMIDEATRLSTDYLTTSRRQIDDFAAERIRRLSELADGLIEVTETIQARHHQVEELNHRLHELITAVGSAAEAVAREAAQSQPNLAPPPKRKRQGSTANKSGGRKASSKTKPADGESKAK